MSPGGQLTQGKFRHNKQEGFTVSSIVLLLTLIRQQFI